MMSSSPTGRCIILMHLCFSTCGFQRCLALAVLTTCVLKECCAIVLVTIGTDIRKCLASMPSLHVRCPNRSKGYYCRTHSPDSTAIKTFTQMLSVLQRIPRSMYSWPKLDKICLALHHAVVRDWRINVTHGQYQVFQLSPSHRQRR